MNPTKNKIVPIVLFLIGIFCVIGIVTLIANNVGSTQQNSGATLGTSTSTSTATTTASSYTLAQVAQHSTAQSCWTAINGGVYNVTSWINQHPGGPEAILSICGKDGSAAFNGQHGGQARPASELASFKIGTLAQ